MSYMMVKSAQASPAFVRLIGLEIPESENNLEDYLSAFS